VNELFTIGEFSRATHLSVKALRHYHDVGLLEPAAVDPATGYRAYAVAQIPAAQVIRRLRDLDMPVDEVRLVLDASAAGDEEERDRLIVVHLQRMERQLEETQASVSALRNLLEGSQPEVDVEYRSEPATPALAVRAEVAWDDVETWLGDALATVDDAVAAVSGSAAGPDSALYATEFFEAHVGEVVVYRPLAAPVAATGGTEAIVIPAADLVVTVHQGPFDDLDRTYAALGAFVAARAIGAVGPVREHYVVADAVDPADLRTEVGWPVARRESR
jgi:DNA-binding transcriptional MerR regulator/effector-binding domain-containing protein